MCGLKILKYWNKDGFRGMKEKLKAFKKYVYLKLLTRLDKAPIFLDIYKESLQIRKESQNNNNYKNWIENQAIGIKQQSSKNKIKITLNRWSVSY